MYTHTHIQSSGKWDCFTVLFNTSSFLIWMFSFSFSCLITLARILKRSDKIEHLCLVFDLRGKAFNFLPLNMMLTVGLLSVAFTVLRHVPSILNIECLYMKECSICQIFFCIYWDDHIILSIILLMWYIIFIDLYMSKSLHSRVNSHSVIVCD